MRTIGLIGASTLAALSFSLHSNAGDSVRHLRIKTGTEINIGVAAQSIKTNTATMSTGSFMASYRQPIRYDRISWISTGGMLFKNMTSLLGANLGTGLGYRFLGQTPVNEQYAVGNHTLLERTDVQSKWTGFFDLTVNILPTFGQSTTTTYTGPGIGVTFARSGSFPFQLSSRIYSLTAGRKGLDSVELGISYSVALQ